MRDFYSVSEVADMLGTTTETLRRWDKSGKLTPVRHPINNYRVYTARDLAQFEKIGCLPKPAPEQASSAPLRQYNAIELFAGAGGLALGLEKAGLSNILLSEINKNACATLRQNRPHWHVIEGDVTAIDFTPYQGKADVLTGGFPCQAFSFAGKRLGFEDARGTLFFEFARAVKETQPLLCLAENVRGLLEHQSGETIAGMISVLDELGYDVVPPRLLKAIFYRVPQKRERVFIVGLKKGAGLKFAWPTENQEIFTIKDALKKGRLYPNDVPASAGQAYPKGKREIMELIPPGGYWRDLPLDLQKDYMKGSFHSSGGKTGMARRISWDEPCLTLTCAPAQKQTERCHPDETRPFTVREYARIQTFTDDWEFAGSLTSQYAQIGNAVPVNLAEAVGGAIVRTLNEFYSRHN
ncbi:DNA (cytosine-5-)-methyltransferase [Methylovulum psychrotolerans]|uniref:DNA (cytosine-5-)-methyltransferase n=1 Tax=Methylovulum psychrotolerans TaxID=1704499 RepID=UPI001BFFA574|nr:DNA (cytosine-5-)-methyltransferase [Methylovulum psychrotolerans]MBT9098011.1 DNA (cytosine-5-)-methyltransferase [Methylovulum psychrotolerans]